jgi:ApaG protein
MDNKHSIRIDTQIDYLESDSQPEYGRFIFAYTITLVNLGLQPARLLSRHWVITDSQGKVQEVRGEGVIGKKPLLAPGESFRYTSAAMIETPIGMMQGEYQMQLDSGELFEADIPPFTLAVPGSLH